MVTNRTESDFDLERITVETGSAYLSGLGSATVAGRSNDAVELMSSSSASHEVSLVFPTGNRPTIGRGDRDTYVYFIIAPEFEEDDVSITLTSTLGQSVTFQKRASLRHNRMALVSLTVERLDPSNDWVDLGLPSGLLWATRNVGATSPEDYGDYFAWGETTPKSVYDWTTYIYCNGDYDQLTKYCNNSSYGYNGFTDNLTILQPGDDAATANYGGRTPTSAEWQELINNTTAQWTTRNGVNGRLFTSSNGNSLFLPAAGSLWGIALYSAGSSGYYWSSSLNTDIPYGAWDFYFYSDSQGLYDYFYRRLRGLSVRAVRSAQ